MDNLKEKTAKGLFWGALNNGTMQVLNLLIGIIVLNRLTPEDTGLIGMLAIFSAIAGNLQSSGFSTALINEKEPTAQQYNSVFWFNILMGGSLYALLFLSAPLIAMFFHQPRLTDLSRFLFLSFFISSFGISTNAYLVKNMMNREITIVNLTALLISGSTAIVLALNGWAYWSLAWQQVVNSTVLILGRFYYVKWKPSLKFSFDYIRQTFSFSMKILVTMIVNTVNQNLLTVIFGRLFRDARVVGNFFQAYKWASMAFQTVRGLVGQLAQPVLLSVREEIDRLRAACPEVVFVSFPGDEKSSGGCLAAGRGFFHINSHGGAEPCPFSPYSDINVAETSLREALDSALFHALRDNGHLLEDHVGGCVLYEKRELVEQLLTQSR